MRKPLYNIVIFVFHIISLILLFYSVYILK